MAIYKPSELHLFLNSLGIFPKKGLSQNFLIDGNIIRKIVAVSEVTAHDTILEIGPGPGSLTEELLASGAAVVAVEKDEILAKALERLQTPNQKLTVACQDILTFPILHALEGIDKPKVIANLPYHLTTPIITLLAPMQELHSITVMVQEEVARRMTAEAGTEDYSSISLFLRFYTDPHYAFTVSRHCFYPVPKVNSAVVVLKIKKPPLDPETALSFFRLTRTAFAHRRKMLRASLRELYLPQKVEEALRSLHLDPLSRPETLSLENFLNLHVLLTKN